MEYCKFLIKLNPGQDPVGGLLCLDYNALSAKQYDYLLYFAKNFGREIYKNSKSGILYLPNMIYSVSLAKFSKKLFSSVEVIDLKEIIEFS